MSADARKEFQSYLFFLRHYLRLIKESRSNSQIRDGRTRDLVAEQRPMLSGVIRSTPTGPQLQTVRNLLFNAWNSEVIANLYGAFETDVKRFTNQWKPVHTYYVVYFLLASIQYLVNGLLPKHHEPTLRYGTNSVVTWLPVPWSLRVDYENKRLIGFPQGTSMWGPSGWNLSNNEPNLHVANFLRRTAQEHQRGLWRSSYRKRRMTAGPRAGRLYRIADVPVSYVSFFNVLWRYRRWANYEEAEALLEGQDYASHTDEFDAAFTEILEATATVLENVLHARIGSSVLSGLYGEYLNLVRGKVDCSAIERRRAAICGDAQ